MQYRCAKFIATRYLQSTGERNVKFRYRSNSTILYEIKNANYQMFSLEEISAEKINMVMNAFYGEMQR